ncbi:MAG: C40 family peptidase [Prevotellaceae bacterium]|nr:C40 family peptidase [Prevotellaceae bacterium]
MKQKILAILTPIILLASCAPTRYYSAADREFYAKYSQALGVKFEGTENPRLIEEVARWMGTPYRYGGSSRKGVDCSGLVHEVYKSALNMALPRTTADLKKHATRIRQRKLRCGDLVFFSIRESWLRKTDHIGIYLAHGKFVHASTSRGVMVSDLNEAYWRKSFSRAGRVR